MRFQIRLPLPLFALLAWPMLAQSVDPVAYQELTWRCIGPHRGGRTVAAAGIPAQPDVFYIGVNNGGVWKTTDAGRTWNPIFDDQPTGSIGALAVAPSNPEVIYVGSGEGLQRPDLSTGDGMYRSGDGGHTWTHLGLRDGQQIADILVDPHDAKRLFVAVMGHPYGPNAERGVFRSTDGGDSFSKVLYTDEQTGATALAFSPADANIVYASLWDARQAPWENGYLGGPGSGFFKSTDGGASWRKISKGLPAGGLGRIGFAVAPSDPRRLYAQVETGRKSGTYRSDDAGESWTQVNGEERVSGRNSDFAEIRVHPNNPDLVYAANTSTWRSVDGGRSWTAIKGAPGGDDYHRLWINPRNPGIMLLAGDQGATVTVNGGATWSSWYNQPTAQFYHVSTDNRFPYRVYGGQQESGSVGIKSRGDHGQITFRDWQPVGAEEYGYIAPDPLHPGVIFGGKLSRFDEATGQTQSIAPRVPKARFLRTAPVLFSPIDQKTLYYAGNLLFKSSDYGMHWQAISPDLSRESWAIPSVVRPYKAVATRRGVIYTVALSPLDANLIWAGTDDGLIHRTEDGGKNWNNLTPSALVPWAKVSLVEASHTQRDTAYAAINTLRLDDLRPHILRTRDGGKSWTAITAGIPDGETVNAVREDPERPGLLFAATERTVYFSLDDGDHWNSLRQNLPVSSIRDLVIHGDDLVIATHGRSFWILDDISPLRQMNERTPQSDFQLYAPQRATRVRWNLNPDTPLPPEEPAGQNPPDGAIIYYRLSAAAKRVAIEIRDGAGRLVRRYRSDDPAEPVDPKLNVPAYWIRPQQNPAVSAGQHRFVWDLHYTRADGQKGEYPISAIYRDTAKSAVGPWVMPGRYTVILIADGNARTQPLEVRMDPRVTTEPATLQTQFDLSLRLRDGMNALADLCASCAGAELRADPGIGASPPIAPACRCAGKISAQEARKLRDEMGDFMGQLQESDNPPTGDLIAAVNEVLAKAEKIMMRK